MGLIEWWQARQQAVAIKNHPVLGPVLECLWHDLSDKEKYTVIANISKEAKQKTIANVLNDIQRRLLIAPSPILPLRERAVELLYAAASFDVLISKPPTASRFISGDLYRHIPELAKLDNNYLKSIFYEFDAVGSAYDDSWDLVLANLQRNNLWANAFIRALTILGDKTGSRNHDWYPQCYLSFCIVSENTYRQLLGWPSLIDTDELMASMKVCQHMAWMEKIKLDSPTIRMNWEEEWESMFGDRAWS